MLAQHTNIIVPPTFDDLSAGPESVEREVVAQPSTSDIDAAYTVLESMFTGPWVDFFLISLIIAVIFAVIALYSLIRVYQIRGMERTYYANQPLSSVARRVLRITSPTQQGVAHNPRWETVRNLVASDNENDWRHAIVEADIMLDEAITARGYEGESLGEKMKQVSRADVSTIDGAWEAHKVRNRIAHEGTALSLSQREVKRVLALFERTLRELGHLSTTH